MNNSFEPVIKSLLLSLLQDKEVKEKLDAFLLENAMRAFRQITEEENQKRLLTISEVANLFGKSKVCVHDWANKGILIRHKIQGSSATYFKYEEVMQALNTIKKFKSR